MKTTAVTIVVAILATNALGYGVPDNLQKFYNRVKGSSNGPKCPGGTILQDGFTSKDGGSSTFAYCKDSKTGVIFIHGNNQLFTNMDIDCDGDQSDHGDGRCGTSTDTQSTTAFQDQVREYSNIAGSYVSDLNANFIPYVVFGNYGTKSGYQNFHPEEYGMQPLSVMAVVCPQSDGSNKLGDSNGDDAAKAMVGEASISLATACYGTGVNGNAGHDKNDVLYIGFPGSVSDTVHKHAKWAAKNFGDFESSIKNMGDTLVAKLS